MKINNIYTSNELNGMKELKTKFEEVIKNFSKVYAKSGRKPTRLLSEYGEILVQIRLLEKYDIELPGGQSKADLIIINKENDQRKAIEVKTSSFKKEEYGEGWGVALSEKKCKNHVNKDFCYFDYLVYLVLEENFNHSFYIFTEEELANNKDVIVNKSGRFKASSHRLWIPKTPKENSGLSAFELGLFQNKDYLERWDKIKL